jgi:hypothetical protein
MFAKFIDGVLSSPNPIAKLTRVQGQLKEITDNLTFLTEDGEVVSPTVMTDHYGGRFFSVHNWTPKDWATLEKVYLWKSSESPKKRHINMRHMFLGIDTSKDPKRLWAKKVVRLTKKYTNRWV